MSQASTRHQTRYFGAFVCVSVHSDPPGRPPPADPALPAAAPTTRSGPSRWLQAWLRATTNPCAVAGIRNLLTKRRFKNKL